MGQPARRPPRLEAAAAPSAAAQINPAYDGSNVTFRLLRAFGWGPLLNLGYYPFGPPFTALNFILTRGIALPYFRLPVAQIRLVHRALRLLNVGDDMDILDLACGRGASTYLIASRFPTCQVLGADILASSVLAARALYGQTANQQFIAADATWLPFRDASFDRILCLEAAFHFSDRGAFLREARRVLRRGGRLAVVDFVWRSENGPQQVTPDFTALVQQTWRWRNFACAGEYPRLAHANGFRVDVQQDWSGHVTDPLQTVFQLVAFLARRRWGQRLLSTYNPLLRSMTAKDWRDLEHSARAHTAVRRHSRYAAYVCEAV
jgi:SAM-dependent methyltransferase